MSKICLGCGASCGRAELACPRCGGTAALAPGDVLGDWRIQGCLAAGPRALIYAAISPAGVPAVVKVLPGAPARGPVEPHFPAADVLHPGLVRYLDLGRGPDGLPWAAMERLEGTTLAAAVSREGPFDPARTARLLARIAEALGTLHDRGIIHGSLCPPAVLLTSRDRAEAPCLLDFRPPQASVLHPPEGARFLAPEQAAGQPADARGDLWALGATAQEALGGRGSFRRETAPLALRRPELRIPTGLDDFLMRLLAPDPRSRPGDARDVARRLHQLSRGDAAIRRERPPAGDDHPWSLDEAQTPRLREPGFVERRREARILDAALDDAEDGQGSVLWFLGDEGSGKTTLGEAFLVRAASRGFETPRDCPLEGLLSGIEDGRRLALFLDDFSSADGARAELLDRVCRRVETRGPSIVVVAASRPLPKSPSGDLAAQHRVLATVRERGGVHRLSRMTDREVDALVQGMVAQPCDAEVRAAVRRAAAGNPLLAIQVFRHLATGGALKVSGGLVRLVPGVRISLPQALVKGVEARLDDLRDHDPGGAAALEVLARVALLGPWATPTTVSDLVALEGRTDLRDRLGEWIDRLAAEGFATRVRWGTGEFLVPALPVTRELALRRAGTALPALHLAAARVLETRHAEDLGRVAEDLADHYEEAGFLDRATDLLLMAGGRALDQGSWPRAGALYRRAEAHLRTLGLPSDDRRVSALLPLAEFLWFSGRLRDASQRVEELGRLLDPADSRSLAVMAIQARIREATRQEPEAAALYEAVARRAKAAHDGERAAAALVAMAGIELGQGRNEAAAGHVAEAGTLLTPASTPGVWGRVQVARARLLLKAGSAREALDCLDQAIELLSGTRDFPDRSEALTLKGTRLAEQGQVQAAIEVHRMGVALCEQAGFDRGLAAHLCDLGTTLARAGRPEEGRTCVLRALGLRESLGDGRGLCQVLTALADLAADRKEWSTARDLATKALALAKGAGWVAAERRAECRLGLACLGLGRTAEAERHLNGCLLTLRRDDGPTPCLADAHLALADLREATGDAEAAQRHRLNAIVILDQLELPGEAETIRQRLGRRRETEAPGG